ncbi:hypothetical protein F5X99DRAFT_100465 [Biscogniauxia marginata]|nr:hypothetical protein F5X99DRAFT_100465 [Biscogniauxia marginata]
MSETILREVRRGFYVVGVFYGHLGIFVNPSHRAVAIARNEGHQACMLPGISVEDCLFVDEDDHEQIILHNIYNPCQMIKNKRSALPRLWEIMEQYRQEEQIVIGNFNLHHEL